MDYDKNLNKTKFDLILNFIVAFDIVKIGKHVVKTIGDFIVMTL